MDPWDVIQQQDEHKSHKTEFVLWKQKWSDCTVSVTSWHVNKLEQAEKTRIPTDSGIYTLLLQPGILNHPACSYLMYVGKAKSLRTRFGQYLTTERRKREQMISLLNKFDSHIFFCYTLIPESDLDTFETAIIKAFMPPCNEKIKSSVQGVKGAF